MNIESSSEVENFIESLQKSTISKVLKSIRLLKEFGYLLSMPYSKYLTKNIYELRIRGKQEVRIFYSFHNNAAYLVHGFVKKTQKLPRRELEKAKRNSQKLFD